MQTGFCSVTKKIIKFPKIVFFWRFSVLTGPWWNDIELCEKTIFRDLKNCFFWHCPCETLQLLLVRKQFFRLWKIIFFAKPVAGNGIPCPSSKWVFLHFPLWNRGPKLQIPSVSGKPMVKWTWQKTNFQVPKNCVFVFFRFSVLIDPWWNEIVLCEKTIFWNPKNCFFNTCLHSLQPSQNHSKSIFGNLNNCFAPITW